jgi:hypothetical protein
MAVLDSETAIDWVTGWVKVKELPSELAWG